MSNIDRSFDKHCVPKDVAANPGPGSYINTQTEN